MTSNEIYLSAMLAMNPLLLAVREYQRGRSND